MKHLKISFLLILLMSMTGGSVKANDYDPSYDAEIDGIYYYLVGKAKTAEVTYSDIKYKGDITVPSTIEYEGITYNVTSIGRGAFSGCPDLNSVTIEEGITNIGQGAFYNSRFLTSVLLPNSVKSIDQDAFQYCDKLSAIVLPKNLETIGDNAFDYCSSLKSIDIPKSVTRIGSQAFYNCDNLKEVHITDLKSWCEIAFSDFYSNPVYYSRKLYLNGEVLKDLIIPSDLTEIKDYSFYGCSDLVTLSIGEKITSIGNSAFKACKSLTSVVIPPNVKTIGQSAFSFCSSLTTIEMTDNVKTIGGSAFYSCSSLTSIRIPKSIETIESHTFYGCNNLTTISIPDAVTLIKGWAFQNCIGLTKLSIGSGILSIYEGAFSGCKELTTVYCKANNVPSTESTSSYPSIFYGSFIEYASLHVPFSSTDKYNTKSPWKDFMDIIPIKEQSLELVEIPAMTYGDDDYQLPTVTNEGLPLTWVYDYLNSAEEFEKGLPSTASTVETKVILDTGEWTVKGISGKLDKNSMRATMMGNSYMITPQLNHPDKITFKHRASGSGKKIIIEKSTDSGNNWTLIGEVTPTSSSTYASSTFDISSTKDDSDVLIRISCNQATVYIDDVEISSNVEVADDKCSAAKVGSFRLTANQEGNDDFFAFSRKFTHTVNKAPLTITANDCIKTQGEDNPELSVRYDGFKYDDDATSLTTQPTIETTAKKDSPIGIYPIVVSGAVSDCYEISYVEGILTVRDPHETTDVSNINVTTAIKNEITYNLAGLRLNQRQRGLNIIRMSDGTTRKVMVK